MSEWISVKDRLPEHNQRVLIFAEGKEDFSTIIQISHIGNVGLFTSTPRWDWIAPFQYFFTNYEITHWMPLPKPPERESIPVWWLKKIMSIFASNNSPEAEEVADVLDMWDTKEVFDVHESK